MSPRRRHTAGPAENAIADLAASTNWSARQVYEELLRLSEKEGDDFQGVVMPSEKTVSRRLGEYRGDNSGAWSFWDEQVGLPLEAAQLLLTVAAGVVVATRGNRRGLTTREASMVMRLAPAAHGLAPFDIYRLSQRALAAAGRPEALRVIEEYLMFRPWDGPDAAARYGQAFRDGWIRELLTIGLETQTVFQEAIGATPFAPGGSFALTSERELDPRWGATPEEYPKESSPKARTGRKA